MTALAAPLTMTRPPSGAGGPVRSGASPAGALFGGLLTLGLYPALAWPARWSAVVVADRPFLSETARWWKGLAKPTDAAKLDLILARLRPRPLLALLPWLGAGFVGVALAVFAVATDMDVNALFAATFGWDRHAFVINGFDARHLHGCWTWVLFAGYALHWRGVRSHVAAVSDLVDVTNRLAGAKTKRERVRNDVGRLGLSPMWVLAAVGMCLGHAWWAIPMVLSGATQGRYAGLAGPRVRAALAQQARDHAVATTSRRPTAAGVVGFTSIVFCPTPACGCRLPAAARFCSRCGTPVAGGAGLVVA